MNIIAINGSPNKFGNTAFVIDKVISECEQEGAFCEKIDLIDFEVENCKACNECLKLKECYKYDDFVQLKARMSVADGIIIGSPYYDGNLTPEMKILMDRISHARVFSNSSVKYILGVSTSSNSNSNNVAQLCASFIKYGFMGLGVVSGIIIETTLTTSGVKDLENDEKLKAKVKITTRKFLNDIKKRRMPFLLKIRVYINIIKRLLLKTSILKNQS